LFFATTKNRLLSISGGSCVIFAPRNLKLFRQRNYGAARHLARSAGFSSLKEIHSMIKRSSVNDAVRIAVLGAAIPLAVSASLAQAQGAAQDNLSEVVVTGTRISAPGVTSSSPILSVTSADIDQLQQPEIEKIFRILPITLPSDGQNVNNGTGGAATINLRGLGAQRNLIMLDGKRLTPFSPAGQVDTQTIPTALIERIDIITGGASAVYGSDAISGAINFITKRDFEGISINTDFSQTSESDGKIKSADVLLGTNMADGRGNIVIGLNYAQRDGVQLGARPLGQLGIVTANGFGLSNFQNGIAPTAPVAGCGGPNSVLDGGSTTTLPTRVAIAGGPGLGQFREDGTLGTNCGVFNFNPYNYYQTPQTRYGGTALGHVEFSEHAEVYGRLSFTNTTVRQQIAPSGVFGNTFWTPLANPFITAQARTFIINAANAGRTATNAAGAPAPTVVTAGSFPNWRDINRNGVVDAADELNISYRRRTVEFGERSSTYDNTTWQFQLGVRGEILGGWDYDVSFQRGQADRDVTSAGYTNVANIANAIDAVSTTACRTGGSACVPINLFGGFGSITPAMAAYSSATALENQIYTQQLASASVAGPIESIKLPTAESSLSVSLGVEYREEFAETTPDECLKLAPSSCLGGAGGNTLPIKGGYNVKEVFGEAILPLVNGVTGAQSLDLELGFRSSDYNITGSNETWKAGLSWRPLDSVLVRVMKQRAARAPNVGELFAPLTASLNNAQIDPCSVANKAISADVRARCIATGMSAAQVGTVEDIVAGQVNTFSGSDLNRPPSPEEADTTTFGVVFTPTFGGAINRALFSVDYYDIDIKKTIGTFGAQEVLNQCYTSGLTESCSRIVRVGGTLTLPGSGIQLYTTNLDYLRAEGVEFAGTLGFDLGNVGQLTLQANINKYLTQESRSSSFAKVIDCNGYYGTQCGNPLPEMRWTQRTSWSKGPFGVSLLWRHLGSTDIEPTQTAGTFAQFRKIDAFNYFDLSASWNYNDNFSVQLSALNVTNEDPPVVGNEAGTTSANSGNTFPSVYDTLGRVYAVGFNVKF
jgi:outer membrane receptor protein involved in Fe transport